MDCIICGAVAHDYFAKTYTETPFDEYMRDIGSVHYEKCSRCGFVFSRTHRQLDRRVWQELNQKFHHHVESEPPGTRGNQPPYAEQALMLCLLARHGLLDGHSMIDYAAGYGTLSQLLGRYFGMQLSIFDPYVHSKSLSQYVDERDLGLYGVVINSAMFEHVLCREDLDRVNRLVRLGGCLVVHTVVCENVPADPQWFYLRPPVHAAFHTNHSMQILMEQWGYVASIYCVPAKSWVLLKSAGPGVESRLQAINAELQSPWFHFKQGFVDYWKGF